MDFLTHCISQLCFIDFQIAAKEHDKKEAKASVTANASEERATSLVSMTKSDKERLTAIAKAHGLSLSAFFRLAADEYIANHDW